MIIKVQNKHNEVRLMVECAYFVWRRGPRWHLEIHSMTTRTHKASTISETKIEIEPGIHISVYDGDTVYVMNDDGKLIERVEVFVTKSAKRAQRMLNAISVGGLCKACIIEESCTLLKDNEVECVGFRPLCDDDKCRCEVCEEYGTGAFTDNNIDMCVSCVIQGTCTIVAGGTTDCTKFQPIGRD